MSSSQLKPIQVWGAGGPNPPKVAMLLKELNIPAEVTFVPFSEVKKPWYTDINPNGRLPSIQDPNTSLTLWESGAILEYLIGTYDKEHKLSFPPGTPEFWHTKQWLFFQTSGQGPYFGQAVWFKRYHTEQLPSAVGRYTAEIKRVVGVLETHLTQQARLYPDGDGPWLIGNKFSVADLAFLPWQYNITRILSTEEFDSAQFSHVTAWVARMSARPKIKEVLNESDKILSSQ